MRNVSSIGLVRIWMAVKRHIGCEKPSQETSKALKYKLGNYRIITEIHDDIHTILVITIGNRKNICD